MKHQASFSWLFVPLVIYLGLMAVLFIERSGAPYQINAAPLTFLKPADRPQASQYSQPAVESLVLFDSTYPQESIIVETVADTLDSLRVSYRLQDVNAPGRVDYQAYQTVVLAFHQVDRLKQIDGLVDWVEQGGRVLFAARPFISQEIIWLYRKLGIRSLYDQDILVWGLNFKTDLLPGAQGKSLEGVDEFLKFYAYPVELDANTRLHLTSADAYQLPLLWEADYGQGRFVVFNTSQMIEKVNRGIIAAAYSRLGDIFVYPVINSSVYFLDNYPAPLPDGSHPVITSEYNRDIRAFFVDIWWPDMAKLAQRYGIRYTGLMVETYNHIIKPPFDPESSVDELRYLGQLLLNSGGDIGLQGYNHVPFCLEADGINALFRYPGWPSVESQQQSIQAMESFIRQLFPRERFTLYAPPSYELCPAARAWIPQVLPDVSVISSLLLQEEAQTYVQDFEEAPDGLIEFPRVTAGYYLYAPMQLALLNELGLHYVHSQSITSDDILDPVRSAGRNWEVMQAQLDEQMGWLQENAPGLRNMTAEEGAMAVQRFHRLKVTAAMEEGGRFYSIHLGNFYDEAFLMLRTARAPAAISGGKITQVTATLYLIEAAQPDLRIELKE